MHHKCQGGALACRSRRNPRRRRLAPLCQPGGGPRAVPSRAGRAWRPAPARAAWPRGTASPTPCAACPRPGTSSAGRCRRPHRARPRHRMRRRRRCRRRRLCCRRRRQTPRCSPRRRRRRRCGRSGVCRARDRGRRWGLGAARRGRRRARARAGARWPAAPPRAAPATASQTRRRAAATASPKRPARPEGALALIWQCIALMHAQLVFPRDLLMYSECKHTEIDSPRMSDSMTPYCHAVTKRACQLLQLTCPLHAPRSPVCWCAEALLHAPLARLAHAAACRRTAAPAPWASRPPPHSAGAPTRQQASSPAPGARVRRPCAQLRCS